jgi:hypothetical protein
MATKLRRVKAPSVVGLLCIIAFFQGCKEPRTANVQAVKGLLGKRVAVLVRTKPYIVIDPQNATADTHKRDDRDVLDLPNLAYTYSRTSVIPIKDMLSSLFSAQMLDPHVATETTGNVPVENGWVPVSPAQQSVDTNSVQDLQRFMASGKLGGLLVAEEIWYIRGQEGAIECDIDFTLYDSSGAVAIKDRVRAYESYRTTADAVTEAISFKNTQYTSDYVLGIVNKVSQTAGSKVAESVREVSQQVESR